MSRLIYPAHGWLPAGAHLQLEWDDQGRDLATNWQGPVQAPGAGECIAVLADRPFPGGFGPGYPVVRIDTGPWAGHEYYLGHTSARVKARERFSFGKVLSIADQGHNWAGTTGGWVELGEAFNGLPGPKSAHHWFDRLIDTPLVIGVPDRPLVYGDAGVRVLEMTARLRDCGYLPRRYWRFNRKVHGAVVAFLRHHGLSVQHGVVSAAAELVLEHAAAACRKAHRREV